MMITGVLFSFDKTAILEIPCKNKADHRKVGDSNETNLPYH
jgi:hypothetical protein